MKNLIITTITAFLCITVTYFLTVRYAKQPVQAEEVRVTPKPQAEGNAEKPHLCMNYGNGVPMGLLGFQFGTYLTIEGVRYDDGKTGICTLLVDTVNNKKLDAPMTIWIEDINGLPEKERCIIRGYETGKMIGMPSIPEYKNSPLPQFGWQFRRFFVATTVVRPESVKLVKRQSSK